MGARGDTLAILLDGDAGCIGSTRLVPARNKNA